MRKLNITPFSVKGDKEPGLMDKGIEVILFNNPNFRLSSKELRVACRVMDAIDKALFERKDSAILEESDFVFLNRALSKFEGFTRADRIFVERIEDAPEIEVKEA